MKIALSEVPVWWFRSACVLVGGVGLLGISGLGGAHLLPRRREIPALLLTAVFAIVCWHIFTGYGLLNMPAGRASIIAYTMPLWAAIYGWFIGSERVTGAIIAGLILGLVGIIVLIGPDIIILQSAPIGAFCMFCASICWAFGTVLVKHFRWSMPVGVTTGWLLLIGSIPITIGALLIEPFPDLTALGINVWLALAYVFLLPMIFGQWAFYSIVHHFSATVAGISTMAVPVIGILASAFLLGEQISVRDMAALVCICGALFSVLVAPALLASRRR
jgi:drug/metabolite transporter (DMT)-like permease